MKALLIALFIVNFAFAEAEKKEDKIYTQAEFDAKLLEAVKKKIDEVKKKSVSELTKELMDKDAKLAQKEGEIAKREELLVMNIKDLKRQIVRFQESKKKILGCVEGNKSQVNARLNKMVEVISNMKPKKASDLLATQDSEISVKILSQIDPVKASKIFNLMEKEISARLQKQYLNMKK